MKALLALCTSGLLLAGCGGQSSPDIESQTAAGTQSGRLPDSASNSMNKGNGSAPKVSAVRYKLKIISPDGNAKALNPSGQVLYSRAINGSERTFFYNGTTSIEVPGTGEKLNSKGQVAGVIRDTPNSSEGRGYLWSERTGRIDLRGPQEKVYSVTGVNDAGQVIGTMPGPFKFESQQEIRAFSWTQAGGLVNLGTFGGMFSFAFAVNNTGQVVGNSSDSPDDIHGILYPFIWTPSGGMVRIQVGPPGNDFNWWEKPTHINNNGQVAGHTFLDATWVATRAIFGTAEEGLIEIGTLSGEQVTNHGPNSETTAMNDAGQVVGVSDIPSGEWGGPPSGYTWETGFDAGKRGFMWDKATGMVDLRTLGGIQSFPSDINLAGTVVGSSEINVSGESAAFIWSRKTGMVNLNTLLQNAPTGIVLTRANKITDSGVIVASSNKGLVLLKLNTIK